MSATLEQVGAALVDALRSGEHDGTPIRAGLVEGRGAYNEIRVPMILIGPPSVSFEMLEEGFVVSSSDWTLELHTGVAATGPSTLEDLRFLPASIAALQADPTLGGVVQFVQPLTSDEPGTDAAQGKPPTMYSRALRVTVTH